MKEETYVDIENVRDEKMLEKWQKIEAAKIDPFDPKHVKDWIGGNIIMQSRYWYVFENDHPYEGRKYQFVIVCKRFIKDRSQMTRAENDNLHLTEKKLVKKYKITGYGFISRSGDSKLSGSSVTRLHAQLIVPEVACKVAAWFGSNRK